MRSKCFFFIIALTISITGKSQNFRFSHLTTANGISQSEVYTFCEDIKGFMWFGTVDGLNRYDGYNIEIFNTDINNPNSLSNSTIRSLVEDEMGRLWIGTDDGLNYYDPEKEIICKVRISTKIEKFTIWSMYIHDKNLLLGTNDGLWVAPISCTSLSDIETNFRKVNKISYNGNIECNIRSIISSKLGGIWVLTDDSVSRIVFQSNNIEPIIIEQLSFEGFNGQRDAKEDPTGCIWIASNEKGIIRYNPETKKFKYLTVDKALFGPFSNKCSSLAFDNEQTLWVGTFDNGLFRIKYDYAFDRIVKIESIQKSLDNLSGLNSNLISSLYVSRSNKLWVGTIGSGINIFDPEYKKFQHYVIKTQGNDIPNTDFIRGLFVDNENRILAGTHNNGLYLLDRETNQSRKLGFDNESVYYIEKYEDNKYFICLRSGISLVELNGSTFKILSHNNSNLSSVFYIVHGNSNIYWCATLKGLMRFRVIENQIIFDDIYNKSTNPAISTDNCRVLFFDKINNQLLVGTEGGGLNYVILDSENNPKEIKVYKKGVQSNTLSSNYVRAIVQDEKKNTWVGTYEGLNKVEYDSRTGVRSFKAFTKKDGLPNNMIELIVEDNDNFLWIGTNGGLSKFSPDDGSFINYNIDDGLQNNEFSEHTVFKAKNGELLMGGINGINVFYPREIKVSKLKPRITVTQFYLNNKKIIPGLKIGRNIPLKKSILVTDTLELSPRQKNIGFTFNALMYPNARKVKYAYMLEGFDNDWNYTDANNRNAIYTNLRHGEYVFKVKATNTDGIWVDTPNEIYINIGTPFFQTWFAYLLYFMVVALIFLYFSHFTIIRYTTKKNLLLENEHNEKLHKLDELRTKFFINISHDLRTPLTLISGPLDYIFKDKSLSSDIKENLILIKRNVKRLNYLVEQLLDIRKAESEKLIPKLQCVDIVLFTKEEIDHFTFALKNKGLDIILNSADEQIFVCFDPGMLSKVYFNIISNAIKFTTSGSIKINIERIGKDKFALLKNGLFDQYLKVEIRDTGSGISKEMEKLIFERFYQGDSQKENGYGIGLSHSKELIESHKGFIEAEGIPNIGTVIRFFIPDIKMDNRVEKTEKSSTEDFYIDADIEEEETIEESKGSKAKTILVVEDNIDMLNYIKNGLKDIYNVILASDGLEGLKIARAKIPDLIVSDVMMPKMDGIEFCREIKKNIKTGHITVILLTAKVDLKTKYEGIELGADDFIPKPFEMEYLLLRINNLLQSRDKFREFFQKNTALELSAITVTTVDEQFIASLIKAIEGGISDENFSINVLESQLGMSHASFYRKIKSLTGKSGQEILVLMRLKRARQILAENKGLRVSEVAYMVGFSNPNYFSKCFKDTFGYAPSEIVSPEN